MSKNPEKPIIITNGLNPASLEKPSFTDISNQAETNLGSLPSPQLEALNSQIDIIKQALKDFNHPLRNTHSTSSLRELYRMTNYERRKLLKDSQ